MVHWALQFYGRGCSVGGGYAPARKPAPPSQPVETNEQYIKRRIDETVGTQLREGWQPVPVDRE